MSLSLGFHPFMDVKIKAKYKNQYTLNNFPLEKFFRTPSKNEQFMVIEAGVFV